MQIIYSFMAFRNVDVGDTKYQQRIFQGIYIQGVIHTLHAESDISLKTHEMIKLFQGLIRVIIKS